MNRDEIFMSNNRIIMECKRRMSPFAQTILNVLSKKWNTERLQRINNSRCAPVPVQRRRIAFTETSISDTPPLPSLCQTNVPQYQQNMNNEKEFHFDLEPNNFPCVSTTAQLLQSRSDQYSTDQNETDQAHNIYTFDLLHSVETNLNPKVTENSNGTSSTNKINSQVGADFSLNVNDNEVNTIPWHDMFDTDLIPKATEWPNKKQVELAQSEVVKIDFPSNKKAVNSKNKPEPNKDTKEITKNVTKHKKQTNNNDNVPKKNKKVSDDSKLSFRKQKYSKTVKNWLDNVDLNNQVETESDLPKDGSKNDDTLMTIICNDKPAKRVVQMQLANREGKMKFDKPQDLNNSHKIDRNIRSPSEVVTETEKVTIKDNLKKGKVKFVPPVKSQIPVKDISYDICSIDSFNFDNQIGKLRGESREICAVLVYSNDFCQLNSQYTEDDCIPDGIMLYINDSFYYFKKTDIKFSAMVNEFLEHNMIFCYDGKSLLIFLKSQFEFKINFELYDIQIGGSLLDPDDPPENFADLMKLLGVTPHYTIATDCVLQKTAWYTTMLRNCIGKLKSSLVEESLWKVFVDIEMRLLPVIADMEMRGILIDVEKLKEMETMLLSRMKSVERECYHVAGKTFQINSTVQVRAILYDELQLDTKCNIKIRETLNKGAKSTSETMLRELVTEHPLPKLILEYRRLHKAHATFLSGVVQHVKDGVIRPTWVQAASATGRVACNNPNVQAIPKVPFSLQPEGSDDTAGQAAKALNLRAVYVPRAGHVLLAADFKHVECRVFAHAAADELLLHALRDGRDLFRVLAANWENKPVSAVSAAERERTKRVVYASLYGAGARTLMDILRVSYDRARDICASFHRTFPSLKSFGREVVTRCAANGGKLSTATGRARRLPNVASHQPALRAQAERQAVNFIVQGAAADVCKLAMVVAAARLQRAAVRAALLLQIHDELVWEVAHEDLRPAAAVIKEVMENCGYECGMAMPLPVALSSGRSWGEMTDLQLDELPPNTH